MKKAWYFAIVPRVITGVVFPFIFAFCLIEVVWTWAIPDLFPGAVKQGLVAANISLYTAIKLAILVTVLGTIFRPGSHGSDK